LLKRWRKIRSKLCEKISEEKEVNKRNMRKKMEKEERKRGR